MNSSESAELSSNPARKHHTSWYLKRWILPKSAPRRRGKGGPLASEQLLNRRWVRQAGRADLGVSGFVSHVQRGLFLGRQEEDVQERFERLQAAMLPACPDSVAFYRAKMKTDQKVTFGRCFFQAAFTSRELCSENRALVHNPFWFCVASTRTAEPCRPLRRCGRNPGSSRLLGRQNPCRFCTSSSRLGLSLETAIQQATAPQSASCSSPQ